MKAMRLASICLALIAGVVGIVAAHFWLESAKIPIDPPGDFEPLEQADKAMFWTVGAMEAFTKSATLNKRAARWTAASVLLSTVAGILGSAV